MVLGLVLLVRSRNRKLRPRSTPLRMTESPGLPATAPETATDVIGLASPASIPVEEETWQPSENPRRFFDELAVGRLYVDVRGNDLLWEEDTILGGVAVSAFFDMPEDVEPTEIAQVSCDQLYRMSMNRPDGPIWINPTDEEPFFCVTLAGLGALARAENPVNFLGAWFFLDPNRDASAMVQTVSLPEGIIRKNRPTRAKAAEITRLIEQPAEDRSERWQEHFREAVLDALFVPGPDDPAVIEGFPYFILETAAADEVPSTSLVEFLERATERGCGIAIEAPRADADDASTDGDSTDEAATDDVSTDNTSATADVSRFLFSFGELMSLRQFRAFEAPRPLASALIDPRPVGDCLVGQPPLNVLPAYALDALEDYLAKQSGKGEVAVTAMAQPKQDDYLHLVVSMQPIDFAMPEYFDRAYKAVAWFLPESYTYVCEQMLEPSSGAAQGA